jgi:putative spermidine/putrescine transport system ATP-binding protein
LGRPSSFRFSGPSGCGKTTLLRLIAGLITPDQGRITIGGRDLTRVPAHKRNIGVVFQSYALFPHLTVADNVAFGLRAQGVQKSAIPKRVREALALVRMEDFAGRSVAALSGGSSSASPSLAPSWSSPSCCSSTSRSARSTGSSGRRCKSSFGTFCAIST